MTFGVGFSYYILGDADYDNDGLTNSKEKEIGTDPNIPDTDGDGLLDGEEYLTHHSDPLKQDTDDDGLDDFKEVMETKTDPTKADGDSDGLLDGQEIARKTDPNNPDTDSDGLSDGDEVKKHKTNPVSDDSDRDGLKDGDEVNKHKTDSSNKDSDGDGLTDGDEVLKHKSNPLERDTDADGLTDGEEVNKYQTSPIKPDTDGDTLSDEIEVNKTNTDPTNPDTDGDTVDDAKDDCPLVKGKPSTEEGKNGCPQAPKIGTKVDFPDILFIVNTDQFNYDYPGTSQNLAKLLSYVQQCEGIEVMIGGHASSEGADDYNQKLSEKRAKKVKEWLLEQGVNPSKVSGFLGYGEREPKVKEPTGKELKATSPEDLEAIRKQNRRISVEVTKTCDEGAKK